MEQIKMKVAEFSALVGTTSKTIYELIGKGELITVKEKVNGREISMILTDENQINKLKLSYGKLPVNEGNCKEILTDNNSNSQFNDSKNIQDAFNINTITEQLITVNKELQNRLFTVTDELITVKGQVPLLEDKANREGLYLQEIKDLKANNNAEIDNLKRSHYRLKAWLITVIILLSLALMGVTGFLIYKLANPTIIEKTNTIETIKEVKVPVPAVKKKK